MGKKILVLHHHPDVCEIIDVRLRDGLKLNGSTEIRLETDITKGEKFLRDNISNLMLVVIGERLPRREVGDFIQLAKGLGAAEGKNVPCVIVAEARASVNPVYQKRYEYLRTIGDGVVAGPDISTCLVVAVREAIAACHSE